MRAETQKWWNATSCCPRWSWGRSDTCLTFTCSPDGTQSGSIKFISFIQKEPQTDAEALLKHIHRKTSVCDLRLHHWAAWVHDAVNNYWLIIGLRPSELSGWSFKAAVLMCHTNISSCSFTLLKLTSSFQASPADSRGFPLFYSQVFLRFVHIPSHVITNFNTDSSLLWTPDL